jgi:hypothetical protein
MLKRLRLGVEVRMVEEVDVSAAWFEIFNYFYGCLTIVHSCALKDY